MYIAFVIIQRRDPGKLTTTDEHPIDFMELLKVFAPSELCPDCKVVKTPRSKHCSICNVCVERYDHHCPWMNTCIGAKNHGMYLSFAWFWWLTSLLIMCIAMDCLGRGPIKDTNDSPLGVLCFAGICNVPWVQRLFGGYDLVLSTVCFIPASILFYIQCKNFGLGLTSWERFSRKPKNSFGEKMEKQAHPLEDDVYANDSILYEKLPKNEEDNEKLMSMRKKKKRGCCLNCKYMMCYHKIPT